MVNPQLENGFIPIPGELVDMVMKTYFSPTENKVFWAVVRKTIGWNKKTDRISFTQFEQMLGINRRHIADALRRLIDRKIVTRIGNDYNLQYGIQTDYEQWESLPIQAMNKAKNFQSLPKQVTIQSLPIQATKSLPKQVNTIDNKDTNNNIIKKVYKESFGEFNNVLLSSEEYQKLKDKFKETLLKRIEALSAGIESKGYKYKSHYAAILSWALKEEKAIDKSVQHIPGQRVPERYKTPEELLNES